MCPVLVRCLVRVPCASLNQSRRPSQGRAGTGREVVEDQDQAQKPSRKGPERLALAVFFAVLVVFVFGVKVEQDLF